ncbi:MAG: outer membrane beta-barrel protein [Bacteroidales bacterium]|nr:outer membrane beta-barrel protein [Bacteroidales bacterium]
MKRFFLSLLLISLSLTAVNAQFTKIGGGLAYGTGYWFHEMEFDYNRSGHIAGFLEGIYEITVPIHVAASITGFYPNVTKEEMFKTTVSSVMFDINGHYVFNSLDRFEVYALTGLDFLLTWKKDKYLEETGEVFKETDNAFGWNIGAGTYIKVSDQFDVFAEAKYILSKYSQFMFNAGVFINIDWLKKHE